MKDSFQDLLLYIPLCQLKFLTPLPKQRLFYETIDELLPHQWLEQPTIVTIIQDEEWRKLNNKDVANQLIQDPNLVGVVVCTQKAEPIQEDILALFYECGMPIIQVTEPASLNVFHQQSQSLYSHLSKELAGAMNSSFTEIASELAKGLGTPLLYLDENHNLLWQTGNESSLREATRWLNAHRRRLEEIKEELFYDSTTNGRFELYLIDIAGVICQSIIVSSDLVEWQKRLMDKFIGLMALMLQTEGMFQEQQQRLQEHFVYDLLYHKFESQKVMIKQAKAWGWNLEYPHHLLLINIGLSDELMENMDWLDEMVFLIEEMKSQMEENIIVFPFQDQIVVLLEDGENRMMSERNHHVFEIAKQLEKELAAHWPHCQFLIGIGKWYKNTTYLNKSYQEANQALKFGQVWFENKHIFHINDLGVLQLLIHIHQEILYDFSQEYLSVLMESDREHGTDYINTLKVFIQHRGIITEVSEALYVHPNTLRNRIKKMEEMTGIDLQNPEEFMNLMVALKILSIINL